MSSDEVMPLEAGVPSVMLVEDNPDDVLLTRRAVRKAGLRISLSVVGDGDDAVAYLEGSGAYADRGTFPLPALILLDLKLPKRSGLDVLQWIRARQALATTPVIVLTSSTEEEDIEQAYRRGANSYLQKPVAFGELARMLVVLGSYWIDTNLTAPRSAAGY
ncbi:Response regulator receiver domain-containing protein [Noviherbaspirillum humi]|uniref:Response regulator receiver domain-containing protein n=1 Tax=Noviherbaspirillum humi TaxID=1688639 RepID=A0A239DR38_9BURK|nr:response regulator [Noviherbaspirillum humi]SNS34368.1 Response regulator receiver domain-containing protein [Noviherbaspirillum humi]